MRTPFIPKTIGHSLHHLYLIVDPLRFPGRYGAAVPRNFLLFRRSSLQMPDEPKTFPIKPLATLLVPFIFFTSNTTKHSNSISHDRVNYFTNYHLIPICFLFIHVTYFEKYVYIQFIIHVKTSTRFSETIIVLLAVLSQ